MATLHGIYQKAGLFAAATIITLALPCGVNAQVRQDSRTVVDMSGQEVRLIARPQRIADLWYAHNAIVIMLGNGNDIKITVANPKMMPWMFKIQPSLHNAELLNAGAPNFEAIKRVDVDVAFVNNIGAANGLQRLQIPAVQVGFQTLESMTRSISLTADVLATREAHDRAVSYRKALEEKVDMLHQRLDSLRADERLRVLHIFSLSPLRVGGSNTIVGEWLRIAGARNAADAISNVEQVTLEEIAALNPDVITLGSNAGDFDTDKASNLWKAIKAVQTNRVYRDPAGVFPFDRYGPEFLLQIQWAAKTLYPKLFEDIDMRAETLFFYRNFFNYDMTSEEADLILAAKPPVGNKQ